MEILYHKTSVQILQSPAGPTWKIPGWYGPSALKHIDNMLGLLHTELTSDILPVLMLLKCISPLYVSISITIELIFK